MTAIYQRELRSYFHGMTGYVFIAFLLVFAGIYTMFYNLSSGYPNFEYVLQAMTIIFLIAIPVLTMRVIAEERRQKTDQLLYTLPLGMTRVVLGKYLAMITVVAVPCVVMAFYPLLLSTFGTVSFPTAYGALVGFFLLSAALSAIGLLISSLTENQAVAAGVCFGVMLLLYFMSSLSSFVPCWSPFWCSPCWCGCSPSPPPPPCWWVCWARAACWAPISPRQTPSPACSAG